MYAEDLDCHLISEDPVPIYMGELPRDYSMVPAPVVVNLCGVFPQAVPPVRVVHSMPLVDSLDVALLPSKDDVDRFLEAVHVHAQDLPSYWHCHAGINRSGFTLAAYLHRYRGLTISSSIALLRYRRSGMVLCNNVFERTLRSWYGTPDEQTFERFTLEAYLAEIRRHRALATRTEAALRDGEEG